MKGVLPQAIFAHCFFCHGFRFRVMGALPQASFAHQILQCFLVYPQNCERMRVVLPIQVCATSGNFCTLFLPRFLGSNSCVCYLRQFLHTVFLLRFLISCHGCTTSGKFCTSNYPQNCEIMRGVLMKIAICRSGS